MKHNFFVVFYGNVGDFNAGTGSNPFKKHINKLSVFSRFWIYCILYAYKCAYTYALFYYGRGVYMWGWMNMCVYAWVYAHISKLVYIFVVMWYTITHTLMYHHCTCTFSFSHSQTSLINIISIIIQPFPPSAPPTEAITTNPLKLPCVSW